MTAALVITGFILCIPAIISALITQAMRGYVAATAWGFLSAVFGVAALVFWLLATWQGVNA